MRLIAEYTVLADCGGDSFLVSEPVVYDSKESFLTAFRSMLETSKDDYFKLGGRTFYKYHFQLRVGRRGDLKLLLPTVHTLDEWFAAVEETSNVHG